MTKSVAFIGNIVYENIQKILTYPENIHVTFDVRNRAMCTLLDISQAMCTLLELGKQCAHCLLE